MRIRKATLIAAMVVGIVPVLPAHAGPFEAIAGWEGDTHTQGYGFVTLGARLGARAGLAVPVRASASFLYYTYDSSATAVTVRAPGVSLLAGLRFAGRGGSFTVLGGGEARWERKKTEDPVATTRDATTSGIVVQADGDCALDRRWRALAFGNYGGAAQYLYGRCALRAQLTNLDWRGPTSFFLGAEGVGQGNDESRGFQAGGFAEWTMARARISFGLRGGYKESWSPGASHRRGPYLGASLYHGF